MHQAADLPTINALQSTLSQGYLCFLLCCSRVQEQDDLQFVPLPGHRLDWNGSFSQLPSTMIISVVVMCGCRQATKLISLDPSKVLPTASGGTSPMHPTVTAWIAWRYLQLLTGMLLPSAASKVFIANLSGGQWQPGILPGDFLGEISWHQIHIKIGRCLFPNDESPRNSSSACGQTIGHKLSVFPAPVC